MSNIKIEFIAKLNLQIKGLIIVGLTLGLALGLTGDDSENSNGSSKCVDKVNSKCFKTAAIAADDVRCGKIGEDLLKKGGSAVDAIIGTLLCDGVVNPYHSGIGGATFFNVYDKQKEKVGQSWPQNFSSE